MHKCIHRDRETERSGICIHTEREREREREREVICIYIYNWCIYVCI